METKCAVHFACETVLFFFLFLSFLFYPKSFANHPQPHTNCTLCMCVRVYIEGLLENLQTPVDITEVLNDVYFKNCRALWMA